MVDKRRSRKKRRTEVSSSEDSSSSESEVEQQMEENDQEFRGEQVIIESAVDDSTHAPSIKDLQIHNKNKQEASNSDIVKTRLALNQIAKAASTTGTNTTVSGSVSADEWLNMMLGEYGDDIDALRTTAADFKGESIALLADVLRTSANVFAEQ